jgi:hypothetical protein
MAERDPIRAWVRASRAQRRVGQGAACACGERRPFALVAGGLCFKFERIAHGRPPYEANHVFGKRNGALTLRVPVNDHRAVLSVAQYSWPPGTLENPDGSPLLEAAARFRGIRDNVQYMLDDCVARAEYFEQADALLCQAYGPNWWRDLPAKRRPTKTAPARKRRNRA